MNNIWSAIEIKPSDDSRCASCGIPGDALRRVENWNSGETYPDSGPEGECEQCHEWLPLYAPDRYTSLRLCGMDYGKARTAIISLEPEPVIVPAKGLKIPDVPWCCSISCLECVVFGPGRCRSCGTRLGEKVRAFGKTTWEYHGGTVYCSKCSAREDPFGNGGRLKDYLRKNHPGLLKLEGTEKRCARGRKCFRYEGRKPGLVVGDGKFCSKRCADGFRAVAQRGKSPHFRKASSLRPA